MNKNGVGRQGLLEAAGQFKSHDNLAVANKEAETLHLQEKLAAAQEDIQMIRKQRKLGRSQNGRPGKMLLGQTMH